METKCYCISALDPAHQPSPAPQRWLGSRPLMSVEKWRKSIEENQPFLANLGKSAWADLLSGPSLATTEHCSEELTGACCKSKAGWVVCLFS